MTTIAIRPPAGPDNGPRGPAFALGVSLLVHAAVIAWLVHAYVQRPAATAPVTRIEVRLRPAPPPEPVHAPAARPAPAPAATAPARPATPPRPRPQPKAKPHTEIITRAPDAPARTDTFEAPAPGAAGATPETPAASADATPTVDIGAARLAARAIARGDGKSLVALPERRPVVDPNSGKPEAIDPIEAARRKDCKTAYAGMGLLAVIPLALDAVKSATKDSGCKW